MNDLIDRQAAIEALDRMRIEYLKKGRDVLIMWECEDVLRQLPDAQPEQTKMIKEIREWINSGNRGSADYFIVDKIEEIINKYER